jgi:hypothetical protein
MNAPVKVGRNLGVSRQGDHGRRRQSNYRPFRLLASSGLAEASQKLGATIAGRAAICGPSEICLEQCRRKIHVIRRSFAAQVVRKDAPMLGTHLLQ